MKDERGSVVSVTNASGTVLAINTYDEYGIPGSANLGRFQYTGQTWLSNLGLYYYKARVYSPTLGRFMQTDPIGYGDGMNLYAYVGNDPVNFVDPLGLQANDGTAGDITACVGGMEMIGNICLQPVPGSRCKDQVNLFAMAGGFCFSFSDNPALSGPPGRGRNGAKLLEDEAEEVQNEHKYTVDVDVSCSADQTFDAYLAARTAPGAGRPSPGQTERNVELFGGNWIRQTIDYSNRTVLNETVRGRHAFHPGSVFIRITPIDGGSNISIIGRGTGGNELFNRAAFEAFFRGGAIAEKIRCTFMGDGG